MRSKLLSGIAAVVLTAGVVVASAGPASARWHGPFGWGGAVAAGVIGGAVAAATSPLWAPGYYGYGPGYAPGYAYGPAYGYNTYDYAPGPYVAAPGPMVAQGSNAAYCEQRYRSYDPASGTYLGFDGQRHPC